MIFFRYTYGFGKGFSDQYSMIKEWEKYKEKIFVASSIEISKTFECLQSDLFFLNYNAYNFGISFGRLIYS